ncbi:MAG: hypothetical protein BHW44_10280 [Roseburia sp. 40_7]|nr:MAG: hypothetical protein BHW44_10280 [Roseburia sp. 40_7]
MHFRTLFFVLFCCLLGFAGITLYDAVPDELYVVAGEEEKRKARGNITEGVGKYSCFKESDKQGESKHGRERIYTML